LGRFKPSPGLEPEASLVAETGVRLRRPVATGSLTLFLNRTFDTIDQRTLADGRRQRINLDGSRVVGLEVAGAGALTRYLRLDGHLTWTHARGLDDGGTQRLVERPAWLGTLSILVDGPSGLALALQPELTAGLYGRTEANALTRLPDVVTLDARLVYRTTLPGQGDGTAASVFLHVDNAFDQAVYAQLGLPMPGRTLRVGLETTF
jgi:iron complex outermembrane receptor protein